MNFSTTPSISRGYEVKAGKKIKLYRVASDGTRTKVKKDIYAFAIPEIEWGRICRVMVDKNARS